MSKKSLQTYKSLFLLAPRVGVDYLSKVFVAFAEIVGLFIFCADTFTTDDLIPCLWKNKPEIFAELSTERKRILDMLADSLGMQRAVVADATTDPDNVILTIEFRDQYISEMLISTVKHDAFLMLSWYLI